MSGARLALVLVCVLIACLWQSAGAASAAEFKVIAHPDLGEQTLSRKTVSKMFLKQIRSWKNGERIKPVDLHPKSKARARFSREVHNKSVGAIKAYWQQKVFTGAGVPPPEKPSDEAVVAYVLQTEGAIGYVAADTDVGAAIVVTISR